jgi:hypothetical protein
MMLQLSLTVLSMYVPGQTEKTTKIPPLESWWRYKLGTSQIYARSITARVNMPGLRSDEIHISDK